MYKQNCDRKTVLWKVYVCKWGQLRCVGTCTQLLVTSYVLYQTKLHIAEGRAHILLNNTVVNYSYLIIWLLNILFCLKKWKQWLAWWATLQMSPLWKSINLQSALLYSVTEVVPHCWVLTQPWSVLGDFGQSNSPGCEHKADTVTFFLEIYWWKLNFLPTPG